MLDGSVASMAEAILAPAPGSWKMKPRGVMYVGSVPTSNSGCVMVSVQWVEIRSSKGMAEAGWWCTWSKGTYEKHVKKPHWDGS